MKKFLIKACLMILLLLTIGGVFASHYSKKLSNDKARDFLTLNHSSLCNSSARDSFLLNFENIGNRTRNALQEISNSGYCETKIFENADATEDNAFKAPFNIVVKGKTSYVGLRISTCNSWDLKRLLRARQCSSNFIMLGYYTSYIPPEQTW